MGDGTTVRGLIKPSDDWKARQMVTARGTPTCPSAGFLLHHLHLLPVSRLAWRLQLTISVRERWALALIILWLVIGTVIVMVLMFSASDLKETESVAEAAPGSAGKPSLPSGQWRSAGNTTWSTRVATTVLPVLRTARYIPPTPWLVLICDLSQDAAAAGRCDAGCEQFSGDFKCCVPKCDVECAEASLWGECPAKCKGFAGNPDCCAPTCPAKCTNRSVDYHQPPTVNITFFKSFYSLLQWRSVQASLSWK